MRDTRSLLLAGVAVVLVAAAAFALVALRTEPPTAPLASGGDDAGVAPLHDAARPVPTPARAGDDRPDILLVTLGTVRADHTSTYGYGRMTTPTLDGLAHHGTVFRRAYSTSSWAVPAVTSLLSGVLPAEHGALHSHLTPRGVVEQEAVSPDLLWLPSVLHDAGYRTVGVTASAQFDATLGYDRGFDDFEALGFAGVTTMRTHLTGRADSLRESDAPFFFWVHVVDPHLPHLPVEPWFSSWFPATSRRFPEVDHAPTGITASVAIRRNRLVRHDVVDYMTTAYDSEIRATDELLGELIALLDDGNLAVVVMSDSGEELDDHHMLGHGHTIFEELVHVPLVVALPDRGAEQEASESTALVSILDVFPTLLDLADAPVPAGLAGTSLMPAVRGQPFTGAREVIFQTGESQVVQGIFDGHYKYGERITPSPVAGLFDLEADPYEQTDILAAHPELAGPLQQRLHDAIAAAEAHRPPVRVVERPIPEGLREQLESLGGPRR